MTEEHAEPETIEGTATSLVLADVPVEERALRGLELAGSMFPMEARQQIAALLTIPAESPALMPFLALCVAEGFSPWANHVWLIPKKIKVPATDGDGDVEVVKHIPMVGRDGLLHKARQTKRRPGGFKGLKHGVVCERDTFEVHEDGSFDGPVVLHRYASKPTEFGEGVDPGRYRGKIIGAWAKCFVDGEPPTFYFASVREHARLKAMWAWNDQAKRRTPLFHAPAGGVTFAEFSSIEGGGRMRNRPVEEFEGAWDYLSAMILKCFDEDTEVLTDRGFQRFAEVTGRVMQVTEDGLEPVLAQPFAQDYEGPMVTFESDDLNFSVTPNHDMVTTTGTVEAGEMYELARSRAQHRIPRIVKDGRQDHPGYTDDRLRLAGYALADGTLTGRQAIISVSRERKVRALDRLGLHHRRRDVPLPLPGVVVTRTAQTAFHFKRQLIEPIVTHGKVVDVDAALRLSQRQLRVLVDAWIEFDGTVRSERTRYVYTSRDDHAAAFEVLAVAAGYSVGIRRARYGALSGRPNFQIKVSPRDAMPVRRWNRRYHTATGVGEARKGLELRESTGKVWCVTVPSGRVVVRRAGFSMVCGNCAQSYVLRIALGVTGFTPADELRDVREWQEAPLRVENVQEAEAAAREFDFGTLAVSEELRERLERAIAEANGADPFSWAPAKCDMVLSGRPEAELEQIAGQVEEQNGIRAAKAQKREDAKADREARAAAVAEERAAREAEAEAHPSLPELLARRDELASQVDAAEDPDVKAGLRARLDQAEMQIRAVRGE